MKPLVLSADRAATWKVVVLQYFLLERLRTRGGAVCYGTVGTVQTS